MNLGTAEGDALLSLPDSSRTARPETRPVPFSWDDKKYDLEWLYLQRSKLLFGGKPRCNFQCGAGVRPFPQLVGWQNCAIKEGFCLS